MIKFILSAIAAGVALMLLAVAPVAPNAPAPDAPGQPSSFQQALAEIAKLKASVRERMNALGAERAFYREKDKASGVPTGPASWGSMCKLPNGGIFTVAHVLDEGQGAPEVGPKAGVTATNGPSDWAFLGVDAATLRAEDFPPMKIGERVTILGFPARDRDGEIVPARVMVADGTPPFVWLELLDADDDVPAEGVVGGLSGSCVLDSEGRVLASVHANGFSAIEGTTNAFALVVPLRAAIREAKGEETRSGIETLPLSFVAPPIPQLDQGRFRVLAGAE